MWTGRAPISDYRIVLKASTLEAKQTWVKKLREVIQETYFNSALRMYMPKSPAKLKPESQRSSRFVSLLFIILSQIIIIVNFFHYSEI